LSRNESCSHKSHGGGQIDEGFGPAALKGSPGFKRRTGEKAPSVIGVEGKHSDGHQAKDVEAAAGAERKLERSAHSLSRFIAIPALAAPDEPIGIITIEVRRWCMHLSEGTVCYLSTPIEGI
jgi:hypothetical protein